MPVSNGAPRARRAKDRSLPDPTEPNYDVVGCIVLFKTPEREVARSIEQFLAVPLRTHLYIIDNSPTPTNPLFDSERVTYQVAGSNIGYGRAQNIALRAAQNRARYNLIMNTDIVYAPDAVLRLHEYLEDHPEAGLAAPQMRYLDGSLQYVCRLLPTPANLFLRRFLPGTQWADRANELYELRFWDHRTNANLPYFQGSFLMVRTSLVNSIGGFDERFFMYGEDIDLCRRLHEVAETVYVADAQVMHEYRRYSNRSLRGTWIGIQNNMRYFNKWGWFVDKRRHQINKKVSRDLLQRSSSPRE
jgi:GT2 family glycosyltransferase